MGGPQPLNLKGQLGHALNILQKHRELIRCEDGYFRSSPQAYSSVDSKHITALVDLDLCRVDVVGESTFAVAV